MPKKKNSKSATKKTTKNTRKRITRKAVQNDWIRSFSSQIKLKESYASLFLGILVVVIGIVLGGLLLKNKGYVTNVNLKSTQVPSPSASVKVSTRTYVVQEGEGLFEIAEKIYGNGDLWTKIAEANKLSNPDQIEAGTKLIIPRE